MRLLQRSYDQNLCRKERPLLRQRCPETTIIEYHIASIWGKDCNDESRNEISSRSKYADEKSADVKRINSKQEEYQTYVELTVVCIHILTVINIFKCVSYESTYYVHQSNGTDYNVRAPVYFHLSHTHSRASHKKFHWRFFDFHQLSSLLQIHQSLSPLFQHISSVST